MIFHGRWRNYLRGGVATCYGTFLHLRALLWENNTINTVHGFDIKSNSAKLATHRVSRKGLTAPCCQRHVMGKITYRFVMGRQPPGVKGMSWAIQYHVIVYMLHEYAITGTHL
jgi:hypothetical protein